MMRSFSSSSSSSTSSPSSSSPLSFPALPSHPFFPSLFSPPPFVYPPLEPGTGNSSSVAREGVLNQPASSLQPSSHGQQDISEVEDIVVQQTEETLSAEEEVSAGRTTPAIVKERRPGKRGRSKGKKVSNKSSTSASTSAVISPSSVSVVLQTAAQSPFVGLSHHSVPFVTHSAVTNVANAAGTVSHRTQTSPHTQRTQSQKNNFNSQNTLSNSRTDNRSKDRDEVMFDAEVDEQENDFEKDDTISIASGVGFPEQLHHSKLLGQLPHHLMLPSFPMMIPQPSVQGISVLPSSHIQSQLMQRSLAPQHMQMMSQQSSIPMSQLVPSTQTMQHMNQMVIPTQVSISDSHQQLIGHHTDSSVSLESVSPSGNTDSKSSRKARWRPSQEQKQTLENIWMNNPYPEPPIKHQIVKQFGNGVTYKQITSWFKHKRENDKNKGSFEYRYSPSLKFSPEHLTILENVFLSEPYAKGKTLQDLANQLGVLPKRIQNWFKHKRSRLAQQGKFEYKPRNLLNSEQITFLRGAFFTNPSPTPELCEQLSSELNVKPEQVTRWFSNERSRKRKREEQLKMNSLSNSDGDEESLSKSHDNSTSVRSKKGRKSKLHSESETLLSGQQENQ